MIVDRDRNTLSTYLEHSIGDACHGGPQDSVVLFNVRLRPFLLYVANLHGFGEEQWCAARRLS